MVEEDGGGGDRFEQLRLQQRRRAALVTQGHTWRTAAVMTLFLSPLGWLFGIAALWILRGLGVAVHAGRESDAERKLRLSRLIVLFGAGVAALGLLCSGVAAARLMYELPRSFEQLAHGAGRTTP